MKKKKSQKKFKWFSKNKVVLLLAVLCIIAFTLRFYGLSTHLFFGPEQGLDFLKIKDIAINHNPVLVGAKTDVGGVFHGPIYYYLAVVPFLMSRGDPLFIAGFFIFINSLTVPLIYKLGYELFNRRMGIISAILFTISFGAISYSRWLSSHPLTIPLSCIFFLGIILFLKGKSKYLYLASISYGLIGQAEFLNYLFFGVMIATIVAIYRKNFLKEKKIFLLANLFILAFVGFANYVLFELRNEYIMTKSIILLQTSPGYLFSISKSAQLTLEIFINSVGELFLPFSKRLGLVISVIGLVLVMRSRKSMAKILLPVWYVAPIVILIAIRHDILAQFFVYAIVPGVLLNAFVLDSLIAWRKRFGFVIFILVVVFCFSIWLKNVPFDHIMFYQSTQPDITIYDENRVIDTIYKQMDGQNFSFQSYTIPYWSQDAWEYLFWQRGEGKYGYMPVTVNGKTLFVIVQDDPSGKHYQNAWLKSTVPKWGTEVSSFQQGVFKVLVLKVK